MASGFAQSCRAFYLLKWLGHPKVIIFQVLNTDLVKVSVLDGGLVAWKKEGFEVTNAPSTPVATQFKVKEVHIVLMIRPILRAV